jgi:hypothetical protein
MERARPVRRTGVIVVLVVGTIAAGWGGPLAAAGPWLSRPPWPGGAVLAPHLGEVWHSECAGRDGWPCAADDEIELSVEGQTLWTIHTDATYNCCANDIVISFSLEGDLITLTEEELVLAPCDCMCCYEVQTTVSDLAPGTYTVEYVWLDYEWGGPRCHTEEVVIPPGDKMLPGPGAPVVHRPPLSADAVPRPHLGSYGNSGCLGRTDGPCEEEDQFQLTVEAHTLHVLHANATYNCCPDDIAVSLEVEDHLLKLTEQEILNNPCFCVCCYDVEATVVDLAAGTYTVEYRWYDYETHAEQCYVAEIVIP